MDAVVAPPVLDHMFKEEDENWPHTVFPDGAWQFHGGQRDKMRWRFWTDEEICAPLLGFFLEEWVVRPSGKRWAWPWGIL
ncbi:MAG: hypothetical protein ACUVQS_02230 [Candidatus Bipolaricaulaceae bacterium]